jgi:hypothetical protein
MTLKGNLENRFELVEAKDLNELVNKLNTMASKVWFKIVTISGSTALLDMAIELVTPVDQELFDEFEDSSENVLQGSDNTFNKNLIA